MVGIGAGGGGAGPAVDQLAEIRVATEATWGSAPHRGVAPPPLEVDAELVPRDEDLAGELGARLGDEVRVLLLRQEMGQDEL